MTTPYLLAICLVAICFIFLAIFGVATLYFYNKHKKILENLTTYEIDANASIDAEIPKILELFVSEIFADYRAKNLDPIDREYISQDDEQLIIAEMASLCSERLSPAMIHKLSLFWNPDSIGAVIADKIYLTVIAYVANFNQVSYPNSIKPEDKK